MWIMILRRSRSPSRNSVILFVSSWLIHPNKTADELGRGNTHLRCLVNKLFLQAGVDANLNDLSFFFHIFVM